MTKNHAELESALHPNTLILTPNNRIKRALLKTWSERAGNGIKPNIQSLAEWVQSLWLLLQRTGFEGSDKQICTSLQSSFIWQKVIQECSEECDLIAPQQLTQSAASAYKTLQLWQLSQTQLSEYLQNHNCDSQNFIGSWLASYDATLERQQLASPEYCIETILKAHTENKIPSIDSAILYAFEQLPPLHHNLIHTLIRTVSAANPQTFNNNLSQQISLPSPDDEIRTAARWAFAKLSENRTQRIGIIALNLGQSRASIERIFTEVFEPQYFLAEQKAYTLPFNFSAGSPLGQTPIIHDALKLLELSQNSWPIDDICQLLQSPFFSYSNQEMALRAETCLMLRRLCKKHISGADLRYRVEQIERRINGIDDTAEDKPALSLSEKLQSLATLHKRQPHNARAEDWAKSLQQELQLLGWPGARPLNSHEHQQLAQWQELMQEFQQLDHCGLALSRQNALSALRSLTQNHHFQAQTPDSPIHILGALEGAGLHFDACWVLGMSARNWPAAASPNPLLPIELQRQLDMPHASAERELKIARALTQAYRHCAPEVIFSSANFDDGGSGHPSSLIAQLPQATLEELIPANSDPLTLNRYLENIRKQQTLQALFDQQGPRIEADELARLKGGSSLLRDQASCPLIAFASHRLGAKTVPEASSGLSAIDRGNIIHAILEQIWQTLKTSTALHQLSDAARQDLCRQCIASALAPYQQKLVQQLPEAFFNLEAERLLMLCEAWLEQDLARPEFEVIATEAKASIVFEKLPLELRLDRLDRLKSGELLLIDYKTGQPNLNQWQGERPSEPQLPLYALTNNIKANNIDGANINAIAFARVNRSDSKLVGLGDLANHPCGKVDGVAQPEDCGRLELPDSWAGVIEHWQRVLTRLACEFKAGAASADYRDSSAERYSEDYRPLTRLSERQQVRDYWRKHQSEQPAENSAHSSAQSSTAAPTPQQGERL